MKSLSSLIILGVIFLGSLVGSLAEASGLYPEPPPADAAFVRFLGFDSDSIHLFAGKSFDLNDTQPEAYLPVSASQLDGVQAGAFVSVVRRNDGSFTAITEQQRNDPAKVFLILLNASDQTLDLKLADGSVTVLKNVVVGSAALRPVNPIKIDLGVFSGSLLQPLATFDVALRRGQNITFFASDTTVRLIENRFGRNVD